MDSGFHGANRNARIGVGEGLYDYRVVGCAQESPARNEKEARCGGIDVDRGGGPSHIRSSGSDDMGLVRPELVEHVNAGPWRRSSRVADRNAGRHLGAGRAGLVGSCLPQRHHGSCD